MRWYIIFYIEANKDDGVRVLIGRSSMTSLQVDDIPL